MPNTLGSRIAEYRKSRGMTQDQLAERLGVSSQAVSKWENGLSCPDISLLPEIADVFHVSVDFLLRGEQKEEAWVLPKQERRKLSELVLRVLVTEPQGNVVKVTIPMSLVKAAVDIGVQLPEISGNPSLKDLDLSAFVDAAEQGLIGRILDVETGEGTFVEVTIECR